MWFLLQGSIIVLAVALLHDKTPNKVVPGIIGGVAAYVVTWIIWQLRLFLHRRR
jgi:hypothetical protein